MAARAIGSLTLSFGLVSIPVKLFTATQSASAISFNMLHKECGSRLKQQYICVKDGSIVERDDIAKGYEFAKDQYVMFTPEEIKALDEVGTHAVEISEFVPIASIDPVYFDKTYYTAPDKGAGKPYALLTEALKETSRGAVGRWAVRGKAYIVLLRPVGDVLTMQQLHFASDVRPASEIEVPKSEVKANELKLARQLIEAQAAERFDPSVFKDDVRERIRAAIDRKVEGQAITVSEEPVKSSGKVIDLMEALRASLEKTAAKGAPASRLGPRKEPKRVEESEREEPAAKPARKTGRR